MDDELLSDFIVEANEHMADIENQFLSIEESGDEVDVDLINEVFRGIHSIKGAAGFLGMTTINDLAHSLENILNMMRNLELHPTSAMIDVMLRAADRLNGLINDILNSNKADVSEFVKALDDIANGETAATTTAEPEPATAAQEETVVQEEKSLTEDEELDRQIEEAIADKLEETTARKEAAQVMTNEPTKTNNEQRQTTESDVQRSKESNEKKSTTPEASIRVSVGVLDKLMNLAGELVLSRNQLMQAIVSNEKSGLDAIASRLDQVTSEVQESIMQTRMQQIGSVFSKFPRVVRDLSSKLDKHCILNIEGKEVEVDKTIIEAIGDPLTHLVRNSIDHGIEVPADRKKANKPVEGKMNLRAFYQAGKVRIEIEDDGAGINPNNLKEKAVAKGILTPEQAEQMGEREALRLIFHPGFSMAEKVTDVSGRGVGMDVVRTNISKLGGSVDVESTVGVGTTIVITLPLTLAIIPSLIVQCQDDRFAIPQVNISELVRLRPAEIDKRISCIKDSEVLRLRGELVPLLRLEKVLNVHSHLEKSEEEEKQTKTNTSKATNILVLDSGQQHFGIVVDALHDSEEIVVKPLGRHLQACPCLSGATILGDGHIALILDVAGIAAHESIGCLEEASSDYEDQTATAEEEECQHMLLFSNHESEHFAVSMAVISRIDRIRADQIDSVGGHELLQYRNTTMSLLRLEDHIAAKAPDPIDRLYVIVFEVGGSEVGIVTSFLQDIRSVSTNIDTDTFTEHGILGSLVIDDQTTRFIDPFAIAENAHPEWFEQQAVKLKENDQAPLILLAEDSNFFRKQVTSMIEERGYRVIDCEDGLVAWQTLESGEHDFDLVVTDIEMPNMDGFEFADRIKSSERWKHIPVIALTSLAGAADTQRGLEIGIDDYQVKMDRDKLLNAVHNFTGSKAGSNARVLQTS